MTHNRPDMDRLALSRACIHHVSNRLGGHTAGVTQQKIAHALGVTQPMISMVLRSDGPKPFSYEVIAKYARSLGKSVGQLTFDLIELAQATNGGAPQRAPDGNALLQQAFDLLEFVRAAVSRDKAPPECNAAKFYKKVLCETQKMLSGSGQVSVALSFIHGSHCSFLRAATGNAPAEWTTRLLDIPADCLNAMGLASGAEVDEIPCLVREATLLAPRRTAPPAAHAFWKHVFSLDATDTPASFVLMTSRAWRQDLGPRDEDNYIVSLLVLLPRPTPNGSWLRRLLVLVGEAISVIVATESTAYATSVAALSRIALLPSDIRSHEAFYGDAASPSASSALGQLEAAIQPFLKRIVRWKEHGVIATADIWSYDWTKSGFASLSPYFRYVNPACADYPLEVHGSRTTLAEAYDSLFPRLLPRPYGKSSFILMSGRALIVKDPGHGATGCPSCSELDIGTFIGLPIVLFDKINDRRIYSVLYLRCLGEVEHPEQIVFQVRRTAAGCAQLAIPTQPSLAAVPGGDQQLGDPSVVGEPANVFIL